ncbi:hypothetical protein B0A55_08648 [Friedmanniomyces simplex]|uniref:Rhodopsin domain-containing protein n=1 Tax=Friedmanniomyces simplex TaxID=329884 RepID=A0A4U0WYK2_9PEZI|nr:hypothetical protein B0A55_08648 [Friedmanniomyces simplex]
MRIPPLSVLLTWPTPNYVDPETRGNASLIVNLIFISLVILVVSLRFYCRFSAGALRFGWDDAMIALTLLCTITMTAVVILANARYGWNRHLYDLPTQDITHANVIAFIAKLVFTLAATFTRLSLCAFYYRLVKDSGIVWFKWVVHGTVAFTIATGIAFVFLTIFLCTPVPYYWQYPPQTAGHCMDEGTVTLAAGIINIFNDLLTAIIPIPLVMRLRMPMTQRIGVCVLFGLGFIVIVAGSVPTFYIWKGLMATWDETWYAYPLWIAAAVEIDIGVICACDDSGPSDSSWRSSKQKPLSHVHVAPFDVDFGDSHRPVLEIMRKRSVELASLRRARTGSESSEDVAGIAQTLRAPGGGHYGYAE